MRAAHCRPKLEQGTASERDGKPSSSSLWEASQFAPLEAYVLHSLDAGQRLRLKLENPLGVAARLTDTYGELIVRRKQVLRDDFNALDSVEEQLAAYEADMRRDFKYHLSHVENVLYGMAERGDKFIDETLSIWRLPDLINGDKLRARFRTRGSGRHLARGRPPHQRTDRLDGGS